MANGDRPGQRDVERVARTVAAGIERGVDLVDAAIIARGGRPLRKQAQQKADAKARAKAIASYQRSVRRYEKWQVRQRRTVSTMTATAGVTGGIGVVDAIAANAMVGPAWAWLSAAGISALIAVRARFNSRTAVPPPVPQLPPPPIPQLRPLAVGAAEAGRLATVRARIIDVTPAVGALHPAAAWELQQAAAQADPVMAAQVHRLLVLDSLQLELPGSPAAAAAASAAAEVRLRLAEGVEAYERLLAAAATLLAAPDPVQSAAEALGPAAQALQAYAHGLTVAADVFGDQPSG